MLQFLIFALNVTFIMDRAYAVISGPSRPIETQLDFVILRNGDATLQLQNGETLSILRGDRFKIERANLVGSRSKADRMDLVGYAGNRDQRDDSGRWIDSQCDLISRFAVPGTQDKFAIKVYRGSRYAGEVYLQLVEPELNYASVRVNGVSKMVRADETLSVKNADQFKVDKVITNFGEDKEVVVRLQPIELRGGSITFKLFEMQLVRKNVIFAKINLQVRE